MVFQRHDLLVHHSSNQLTLLSALQAFACVTANPVSQRYTYNTQLDVPVMMPLTRQTVKTTPLARSPALKFCWCDEHASAVNCTNKQLHPTNKRTINPTPPERLHTQRAHTPISMHVPNCPHAQLCCNQHHQQRSTSTPASSTKGKTCHHHQGSMTGWRSCAFASVRVRRLSGFCHTTPRWEDTAQQLTRWGVSVWY